MRSFAFPCFIHRRRCSSPSCPRPTPTGTSSRWSKHPLCACQSACVALAVCERRRGGDSRRHRHPVRPLTHGDVDDERRQAGCRQPCQIVAADMAPSGGAVLVKTYHEVRELPAYSRSDIWLAAPGRTAPWYHCSTARRTGDEWRACVCVCGGSHARTCVVRNMLIPRECLWVGAETDLLLGTQLGHRGA